MHSRRALERPFDALTWLALGAVLALALATFRQYGVAWDEQGEVVYGDLLLKYYASGFQDRSAFEFANLRFYGGAFEMPAALLARVSPFGVYETRHLFGALLGLLGLVATWRIARAIGGERAGALAVLLLALNPSWYGHTFINARDAPFASGMACCLLLTLRMLDQLPRIRLRTSALFGLALGWTMSIRVGGILAVVFLLVPIALWGLSRARPGTEPRELSRDAARIAVALVPAGLVACAVMAVLWPWAAQSALNPWRALTMFARFPFEGLVLFEGRLFPATALPASYLPMLLALTQPETLLAGVGLAALLGVRALLRRRAALGTPQVRIVAVAVAAAFPIAWFVIARPVAYNGMRHFLFVLPPLCVLAALAFDHALRRAPSRSMRTALAAALVLCAALQLRTLIALHPDEYVYYNALVGGPRGAQGRYELDYWGTSLAEATQQLVRELERGGHARSGRQPVKIYVCGNLWSAATYFPPWFTVARGIEDADYQIAIAQFYCKEPEGSRRLLEVKRDGALLSFVTDLRQGKGTEVRHDYSVRNEHAGVRSTLPKIASAIAR